MILLSSIAASAYTDLVRLLKDEAVSGVEGKPALKQRGTRAYWYAARRVGSDMRFHAAAIYRAGVLVQVPRPERYAIHKLIIADRRRDGAGSLRASKDREQAAFLVEAMAEDRPDDLRRAYAAAVDVGPRWREHIANSLKRMPKTMSILDGL